MAVLWNEIFSTFPKNKLKFLQKTLVTFQGTFLETFGVVFIGRMCCVPLGWLQVTWGHKLDSSPGFVKLLLLPFSFKTVLAWTTSSSLQITQKCEVWGQAAWWQKSPKYYQGKEDFGIRGLILHRKSGRRVCTVSFCCKLLKGCGVHLWKHETIDKLRDPVPSSHKWWDWDPEERKGIYLKPSR